jgi:riboflavin kinase/FMN adenylyltransferase
MKRVLAIGNFDGCHLGHQALFQKVLAVAKERSCEPLVLAFEPHTRHVIQGPGEPQLLSDSSEKRQFIESLGIRFCLAPFTKELLATDFRSFAADIVRRTDAVAWVLGHDQRFGRGGKGSIENLPQYFPDLEVDEVKAVCLDGRPISSSRIRAVVASGKMELATALLGRPYSLRGLVEHGNALGRTIGFPTANLAQEPYKQIPSIGVYAGETECKGKVYRAVVNVGTRPTIGKNPVSVEAHLLGFEGDLYGETLSLSLLHKIRDEKKFSNLEELKEQIKQDCQSL